MTALGSAGSTAPRAFRAPRIVELDRCLDTVTSDLLDGRITDGMERLFLDLRALRQQHTPEQWRAAVTVCRSHPLADLLYEDPVTAHSLARPRGYPGDAVLLDLIYGHGPIPETTDRGAAVYRFNVMTPAARAVRARRRALAEAVMRTAAARADARVLAVAAGHLREYHDVAAWAMDRVSEWVAVDQDPRSLAEVARTTDRALVTTLETDVLAPGAVADLRGAYDLIYCAGLYDYLSDGKAADLTIGLFDLLAPEGRLLIANFLPDVHGVGYMEAYLDWWLQYRTAADMAALTTALPENEVADAGVTTGPCGNTVHLHLRRHCGHGDDPLLPPGAWRQRWATR